MASIIPLVERMMPLAEPIVPMAPLVKANILNDVIFRIGNLAHVLGCLQNWQPTVREIGTIWYVQRRHWLNPELYWHASGVIGRIPNPPIIRKPPSVVY